jgi:sigma-E factor negative regulatory protein RseC
MEELATVTAIDNDVITVVSQIKSTCNSCSQVDSCANGQVAKAIPQKNLSFTIKKSTLLEKQSITIGDRVVLTVPEADVLSSAWQVYLLPILGLFSFSAFGQWLIQQNILAHELIALIIGLSGGYLGYRIAKHLQNEPNQLKKLQPQILRILPKQLDVDNISAR